MNMHLLINLSWKCQLKCPYCLIPHIKVRRRVKEHSWQEWAAGIIRHTTPGSVIDVAGGEPTLFPGLALFLREIALSGRRWAITTNAVDDDGVSALLEVHPPNCILVNVSDHPGNQGPGPQANIDRLRAVFPTNLNRVDVPEAGQRGGVNNRIPYQSYREGTEQDHKRRICDSGIRHWVADPAMDVFLCNVAMATGRKPIGNLANETLDKPSGEFECDWGCSSCYLSVPGAWACNQREVGA